jgi:hypothetical protein
MGPSKPSHRRSILYFEDGKIIFNFARIPILGRTGQAPLGLTEAQAEALDAVHFQAKKSAVKLPTEPGDMFFLNNFGLLHGRSSFQDGTTKRHLVRLWIQNDSMSWQVPEELKPSWHKVFDDNLEDSELWNIEPVFLPTKITDEFASSNH